MRHTLHGNPDYGELVVELEAGETFLAESGAMAWLTGSVRPKGRLVGGLGRALLRKLLGGESLFLGEYRADGPARIGFSPRLPGTVLHRKLDGKPYNLTGGSFLACTEGVDVRPRFGGLKAFFSSEGAFLLECSGHGDLFFNSYGAVVERELSGDPDDALLVDNGHLVAWEPTLDYTIAGSGGLKQTLFSGEGLLMRFQGRGKILLQSRHFASLAQWLRPYCK